MKQIKLTQGKIALVDDEDFEHLNQWKWQAKEDKVNNVFYAERTESTKTSETGKRYCVKMHRQLMRCVQGDTKKVDHKDHNGLNNQKENLRVVTHSQNLCNRNPSGISKYLGVSKKVDKYKGKISISWYAQIKVEGKVLYLGRFPFTAEGEIQAALVYDEAAKKHHGEFANLNFKN